MASEQVKEENSEKKAGKGVVRLEQGGTSRVASVSGEIVRENRT